MDEINKCKKCYREYVADHEVLATYWCPSCYPAPKVKSLDNAILKLKGDLSCKKEK